VEVVLVEQLLDDVDAHTVASLADLLGDVAGGQVGPDDFGLRGAAGGVFFQDGMEVFGDLGIGV
jgi:hypothetical protein